MCATNAAPISRPDVLDFWELLVVFSDVLEAAFEFLKIGFCGGHAESSGSKFNDSDEVLLSELGQLNAKIAEAGGAALLSPRFPVAFFR